MLVNKNPKVSIITVCFNSAKTIEKTIQSVISQTWANIEYIVIDGGSSDSTLEILDRNRQYLSYLISEPDRGIYDAMNKGLLQARGDIVCFLNADDFYVGLDVISNIVHHMQEHQLDAVLGDVAFFHPSNPTKIVRRYRSSKFNKEKLAWGWMPAHPAFFLTKVVIDRVGQFNINYKIAGDFDYVIRVFSQSNIRYKYLPEVLVHMSCGGASTSGIKSKIALNLEVLKACRENGLRTNLFKILLKYPAKIMELFLR